MSQELQPANFKRIALINWSLTPLLLFFFAWPFYRLGVIVGSQHEINILSSFIFATSFTLTILHGHVSVAVGSLHRSVYYNWLEANRNTYGLLFSTLFITTRFRLSLLIVAMAIQLAGGLKLI